MPKKLDFSAFKTKELNFSAFDPPKSAAPPPEKKELNFSAFEAVNIQEDPKKRADLDQRLRTSFAELAQKAPAGIGLPVSAALRSGASVKAMYDSFLSGINTINAGLVNMPAYLTDAYLTPGNFVAKYADFRQAQSPEWMRDNKVIRYYDNAVQSYSYKNKRWGGENFEEIIKRKDAAEIGSYITHSFIENMPTQLAIMGGVLSGFSTPALLGMGFLAASQTHHQNLKEDIDTLTSVINATSKGALETLSEMMGTVRLLKGGYAGLVKGFGKSKGRKIFLDAAKAALQAGIQEGPVEEGLNSVAGDFVDGITGVRTWSQAFDGMAGRAAESSIVGFLSGATMTTPALYKTAQGSAARKMIDDTKKQADDAAKAVAEGKSKVKELVPDYKQEITEETTIAEALSPYAGIQPVSKKDIQEGIIKEQSLVEVKYGDKPVTKIEIPKLENPDQSYAKAITILGGKVVEGQQTGIQWSALNGKAAPFENFPRFIQQTIGSIIDKAGIEGLNEEETTQRVAKWFADYPGVVIAGENPNQEGTDTAVYSNLTMTYKKLSEVARDFSETRFRDTNRTMTPDDLVYASAVDPGTGEFSTGDTALLRDLLYKAAADNPAIKYGKPIDPLPPTSTVAEAEPTTVSPGGVTQAVPQPEAPVEAPTVGVTTVNKLTPSLLKSNPDKVYLFGDNDLRVGKGGQAIVRDEPNAIGIRTKKEPSMKADAFYTDAEYDSNIAKINEDIERVLATGKEIVIPSAGIGTGLARLKQKAPRTFGYLTQRLSSLQPTQPPSVDVSQVSPVGVLPRSEPKSEVTLRQLSNLRSNVDTNWEDVSNTTLVPVKRGSASNFMVGNVPMFKTVEGKTTYYSSGITPNRDAIYIHETLLNRDWENYKTGKKTFIHDSIVSIPPGFATLEAFRDFVIAHERVHLASGLDGGALDENLVNAIALEKIGRPEMARAVLLQLPTFSKKVGSSYLMSFGKDSKTGLQAQRIGTDKFSGEVLVDSQGIIRETSDGYNKWIGKHVNVLRNATKQLKPKLNPVMQRAVKEGNFPPDLAGIIELVPDALYDVNYTKLDTMSETNVAAQTNDELTNLIKDAGDGKIRIHSVSAPYELDPLESEKMSVGSAEAVPKKEVPPVNALEKTYADVDVARKEVAMGDEVSLSPPEPVNTAEEVTRHVRRVLEEEEIVIIDNDVIKTIESIKDSRPDVISRLQEDQNVSELQTHVLSEAKTETERYIEEKKRIGKTSLYVGGETVTTENIGKEDSEVESLHEMAVTPIGQLRLKALEIAHKFYGGVALAKAEMERLNTENPIRTRVIAKLQGEVNAYQQSIDSLTQQLAVATEESTDEKIREVAAQIPAYIAEFEGKVKDLNQQLNHHTEFMTRLQVAIQQQQLKLQQVQDEYTPQIQEYKDNVTKGKTEALRLLATGEYPVKDVTQGEVIDGWNELVDLVERNMAKMESLQDTFPSPTNAQGIQPAQNLPAPSPKSSEYAFRLQMLINFGKFVNDYSFLNLGDPVDWTKRLLGKELFMKWDVKAEPKSFKTLKEHIVQRIVGIDRRKLYNDLFAAAVAQEEIIKPIHDEIAEVHKPKTKEYEIAVDHLKLIMFGALHEIRVSKDDPMLFQRSLVGLGLPHFNTLSGQRYAEYRAALELMEVGINPFNDDWSISDKPEIRKAMDKLKKQNPSWALKMDPLFHWNKLSPKMKQYTSHIKSQYYARLGYEQVLRGVFSHQAVYDRDHLGWAHRASVKKGEQAAAEKTGRKTLLSSLDDPQQKHDTPWDYWAWTTDSGMIPIMDPALLVREYITDSLTRIEQQNLLDDLKARPAPLPNITLNLVEHAEAVMARFKVGKDKANAILEAHDFVKINPASGLATWITGQYRVPYVHKSVHDLITRILFKNPPGKIMRGWLWLNQGVKRVIMLTPPMFALQIASTPAAWHFTDLVKKVGRGDWQGAKGDASRIWNNIIRPTIPFGDINNLKLKGDNPGVKIFKVASLFLPFQRFIREGLIEGTKIAKGTYDPLRYLKTGNYDFNFLKLAMKHGIPGMNFDWAMLGLFERQMTTGHPLEKIARENLTEYVTGKGGIDQYVFNHFIAKNVYELTHKFYTDFINDGLLPDDAMRRATTLVGDITGMVHGSIYGDEGKILQSLAFARDFTVTFFRQATGALFEVPGVSKIMKKHHGYKANGWSWLNPFLHGTTSLADMEYLAPYYFSHLAKIMAIKIVFVNLIQYGILSLWGDEEDKRKGMFTIDNDKRRWFSIRLPQKNKTWRGERYMYVDMLALREANQMMDLMGLVPGGRGWAELLRSKVNYGVSTAMGMFTGTDALGREISPDKRVYDRLGRPWLPMKVKDWVEYAGLNALPSPFRPDYPGVQGDYFSQFLGFPIKLGESYQKGWDEGIRDQIEIERITQQFIRNEAYEYLKANQDDPEAARQMWREGKISLDMLKNLHKRKARPIAFEARRNRRLLLKRRRELGE